METIKQALQFGVNTGVGLLEENACYRIYKNLLEIVQKYDNIYVFLRDHQDMRKIVVDLLKHVKSHPNYSATDKITNYHILGYRLHDLLPNFIKETKKADDKTTEDHIRDWFAKNAGLDYDADKNMIQAGFVALICIKCDIFLEN